MGRYIIYSLLFLVLAGCKKSDQIAPFVEMSKPMDLDNFLSGDDIQLNASYTDDIELIQYSVDVNIENVEQYNKKSDILSPFSYSRFFGLSGTEVFISEKIPIPVEVATGVYEFKTFCVDFTGKLSNDETARIFIQNRDDQVKPQLTVNTLVEGSINNFSAGANIRIEGFGSDDQGLGALFIRVVDIFDTSIDHTDRFDLSGINDSFDLFILAPSIPGDYRMFINLADHVNNQESKEYSLKIN